MGYDNQKSPELDQALIFANQTITLMKLYFFLPTNKNILSLASSTLESCLITENQVIILTESDTDYGFSCLIP